MKYRKIVVLGALVVSLCLTSCQSSQTLLNSYSQTELLTSSDVLSMIEAEEGEGFADDFAVVSVDENASSIDDTAVTANAALLIQTNTNEALYYKNIYEQVAPASLTKLMTALLILENGNLEDDITITQEMLDVNDAEAQMIGFSVGDVINVKDMLYAMLVYSGNDASNALAIYLSGSVDDFVILMNERAQELGAVHTNYVNACGLDADGHVTCAYDLYLIFSECITHEEFCEAIGLSSYVLNYTNAAGEALSLTLTTTNLYLAGTYSVPEGIYLYGGKTGTTTNAGTCLILYSMDEEDNTYISVILGTEDKEELYEQMSILLNMTDA